MQSDSRPAWLEERRKPELDVWKIAVGVATGILVASVIGYFVRLAMINHALGEFTKTTSNIVRDMNLQTARQQERLERAKEAAIQREAARRAEEAAKQRAHEAAIRHAQELQLANDEAWNRYYRKPAFCENAEGQAFVDCANHHIKAKRRFEELWTAGKL
ncbi:hypothetical protein [Ramlibacter sp.]|uniref:hypothetical protein n=1 Tax=Ramlibacter sp. TaxID=1917967 RepID=UPI002D2E58E3|nr:hypothetical protein [Ramlibacter sp.]HYD76829.1 hypothetical protein [Ramlibacter sp.]